MKRLLCMMGLHKYRYVGSDRSPINPFGGMIYCPRCGAYGENSWAGWHYWGKLSEEDLEKLNKEV